MKKILFAFLASAALCVSVSAEEAKKDESKWASISYYDVPIYKILEAKDGYVVIYAKNKVGSGSTVIPKNWINGDKDNPRKLKFRNIRGNLKPFMTVVKKDNSFMRVILSVPMSKTNSVWGLADYHKQLEGTDKDTLEDLPL